MVYHGPQMGLAGSFRAGPKMEVFSMKNLILLAAILAVATMMGGCAALSGPGVYNGLGDHWSMFNPGRSDGKQLEPEQCKLLDTIAREELVEVKEGLSSPSEAAASSGFPLGLAGAGAGGVIDRLTAISGGLIGLAGGSLAGLQVWSYSAVWQLWERVDRRIEYLRSAGDPRAKDLYITAAFVRAKNDRCKALIQTSAAE